MTIWGNKQQVKLDDAVTAIKEEPIDARIEARAAERVRAQLKGEAVVRPGALHGCAEVAALIPAYRREELGDARRLLVEDHARECVACRERLEQRPPARVLAMPWSAPIERARAAALGLAELCRRGDARPGGRAGLRAAMVLLARSAGRHPLRPIRRGRTVPRERHQPEAARARQAALAAEKVRTGGGGQAVVRLADGSTVEMGERAQLAVRRAGADTTILLDRGNIIVQAAKRSRGHLYVAAGTARVAVTGTVFSVSRGISGSRVSVIEGEVHVDDAGRESVLHPGQQVSTGDGVAAVPVHDEIAWSRNRDAPPQAARRSRGAAAGPRARPDAGLALREPADAARARGHRRLRRPCRTTARRWPRRTRCSRRACRRRPAAGVVDARAGSPRTVPKLSEAVEKLRALGDYLGDEILFTVAPRAGTRRRRAAAAGRGRGAPGSRRS